jgi:hypothetical protein
MANQDRGEVELRLGDQSRTLRFRTAENAMLEQMLDSDPFTFVAQNKGRDTFLIAAIRAGLSRNSDKEPITPKRVTAWLDADGLDKKELLKSIMYAIARGKQGEEAKRLVRGLDEAFAAQDDEESDGEASTSPGPLGAR